MTKHIKYLGLVAAAALAACSSTQQSPIYQQSNAYSNGASQGYAQPTYASYNGTSAQADQACLRKETNRELIGGAVGGTAGAFAGKELIGGTAGTLAGAALGGAAGFGIGNLVTNCEPVQQQRAGTTYQTAPATFGATPAGFSDANCPTGTAAQSNGTCLLTNTSAVVQTPVFAAAPATINQVPTSQAPTFQQYQTAPQVTPQLNQPVVRANAFTPASPHLGTQITRQLGGANYQVKSGDTVYSLARSLCVPVTEIQSSNELDSNFGIKIGQGLQLPSSRC